MEETHSQIRRSGIFEEGLRMTKITEMFDLKCMYEVYGPRKSED